MLGIFYIFVAGEVHIPLGKPQMIPISGTGCGIHKTFDPSITGCHEHAEKSAAPVTSQEHRMG
jgi:hypothetical protein